MTPAETRRRVAHATASMLALPALMECIESEVEMVFEENPALPRTEQARRVAWALVFDRFAAAGAESVTKTAA